MLTDSLQNTTSVAGLINYEQENFFETHNDKLIETKNIMGYQHFWERIDTFFKIQISQEVMNKIHNFYCIPEDGINELQF